MRLLFQASVIAVFSATGALSQDLIFSPQDTLDCISSGQPYDGCVGSSAGACVDANGYATVVESACFYREAEWWDGRLNALYADVMAQAREMDAENGGGAPSQADALRDMQRAWIAYRDATCSFEASQWGGGTGAGPAYNACLMYETARQAKYLETAKIN